jgi:predicted membrane-bound spermidine synthase
MRFSGGLPAKSLSFAVGLLSLGTETLWVRTYSFLGESTPRAVSFVLAVYLLGIAVGAALGSRLCGREKRLSEILVVSLLCGSATILVSPFILALTVKMLPVIVFEKLLPASLAFLPAFIFSICFPICHHLGTTLEAGRVGKSMSRVYASNIAGSVTGPLFVNFGLLQFATTQLAFALLGTIGVSLGIISFTRVRSSKVFSIAAVGCAALAIGSILVAASSNNWLIKSLAVAAEGNSPIRRVVETRQGIVVSYRNEEGGDIIYGGNVYDGRTNLDPYLNSNGINRILVLAALRPRPKRVLMIGLSIGSWSYLIAGFPGVELIDIVEINPGYLEMIPDYQKQDNVLHDPRIRLHIDDGRKFLRSVPEGAYDLVVMNTTWHWRAYASLLLSREFLTLARSRMAPAGLFAFNTTGSPDSLYTAASVFAHAYRYDNFAICADFDWRAALEQPASVAELIRIEPAGLPLLMETDRLLAMDFLSLNRTATTAELAAKTGRRLEIITDRNLITEYRYGR